MVDEEQRSAFFPSFLRGQADKIDKSQESGEQEKDEKEVCVKEYCF